MNTGKHPRLADEFRIDTIPRSYVIAADGQIVDRRTGYVPVAEYAAWLKTARTKPPATTKEDGRSTQLPSPAGDEEALANLVIWFVDSSRSIPQWNDSDWTGHAQLLGLLRVSGLRPRIEHLSRENFPARWDRLDAMRKAPDLIVADKLAGLVGELEKAGRLLHIMSERLTQTPEVASCTDFKGKWIFRVAGSRNETSARNAVKELLRPGPETDLPGTGLPDTEGRDEAVATARRAAVAFFAGDLDRLKDIISADSPQLTRCTKPDKYRRDLEVEAESVEIRGNPLIAFARAELRFRSNRMIGADPVMVVLRREGPRWKAFAISADVLSVRALYEFCRLELRPTHNQTVPPKPRLLTPPDGAALGGDGRSFAWEIPMGGEPLTAQICQVLLNSEKSLQLAGDPAESVHRREARQVITPERNVPRSDGRVGPGNVLERLEHRQERPSVVIRRSSLHFSQV